MTLTTPLLWVICHPVARIDIAYLGTKFDHFRFSHSSDMIGACKIFNGSHDLTTPLSAALTVTRQSHCGDAVHLLL